MPGAASARRSRDEGGTVMNRPTVIERQIAVKGRRGLSLPRADRLGWIGICLALVALPHDSGAQAPDTLWARTFGGANIDIAHSVQQTADGGYVVAGYTRSFGAMSGRNVLLAKFGSGGGSQWHNAFGGNDDDEGYAVQQTADGGYIVAGHTKSFGAGGKDVLLVKAYASGDQEWLRTFGGASDDEGYAVQQTADGGFIIGGVTSSYGAGSRDMWLIKTDADGNESWRRTHGGMSSDGAWSVQQTADGGFILAGWTFSYGLGYLGNAWLVKADSLGYHEWNRAFGGADVDRAHAVQQTADGGYIIAGYTDSYGAGLYDMLLIKTDPAGNQDWLRTFGGTGRDYAQAVQQTADGGYIVAGYTLSFGAGSEDVWLVKTDDDGYAQWDQTYGGTSSDAGYAVRQTIGGGYIVAGYTLSYGAGLHDVWLIRLAGGPTGVGEIAALRLFQNHPNPFNPITTIRYALPADGAARLAVHDVAGRRVRTLFDGRLPAGEHRAVWDGRDDAGAMVAGGIYFYRLQAVGHQRSGKMVFAK